MVLSELDIPTLKKINLLWRRRNLKIDGPYFILRQVDLLCRKKNENKTEQAYRAAVRGKMIKMNLKLMNAYPSELVYIKGAGAVGNRASTCSILSIDDTFTFMIQIGKKKIMNLIKEALSMHQAPNINLCCHSLERLSPISKVLVDASSKPIIEKKKKNTSDEHKSKKRSHPDYNDGNPYKRKYTKRRAHLMSAETNNASFRNNIEDSRPSKRSCYQSNLLPHIKEESNSYLGDEFLSVAPSLSQHIDIKSSNPSISHLDSHSSNFLPNRSSGNSLNDYSSNSPSYHSVAHSVVHSAAHSVVHSVDHSVDGYRDTLPVETSKNLSMGPVIEPVVSFLIKPVIIPVVAPILQNIPSFKNFDDDLKGYTPERLYKLYPFIDTVDYPDAAPF